MMTAVVVLGAAGASFLLTGVLRHYAIARSLMDIPNNRSSHQAPTPRGGGLAIVVTFLIGILTAGYIGVLEQVVVWAFVGGGIAVASIGFLDDHRPVRASHRLMAHIAAFGWTLWCLGGLPPVDFGLGAVDLGWFGTGLELLFLVWFLNLYNFMDGIDGIAGLEAIAIAASAALLLNTRGATPDAVTVLYLLIAATAGFLIWNWPPARIFMGDVGSGFLGFVLGSLAVFTVARGFLTVWAWLILYGVFFVDATATLFRRIGRRDRLDEAHRSHAYQRLARYWGAHRPVTLLVLAVNVLWLLPLAWAAVYRQSLGGVLTALAWAPLSYAAWRLGAGVPGEIGDRK